MTAPLKWAWTTFRKLTRKKRGNPEVIQNVRIGMPSLARQLATERLEREARITREAGA